MTSIASLLRGTVPAALVAAMLTAPNASAQTCSPQGGKPFRATFDFQEQQNPSAQCPIPPLAEVGALVFELRGRGTANNSIGSIGASSQNCVITSQRITNGLDFFGPRFVLTASNGDQLFASYSGTASPALSTPAGGLYNLGGAYTITGGTGRFARAQGCGTLTGSEVVSFAGVPSGFGRISLQGVLSLGPKAPGGGNNADDDDDNDD